MDQYIGTNDFDSLRLGIASAEDVLRWSFGEVLKPETINYRTQKPERDGLFCERIFGPIKDINPNDSKLKGVRSREMAVDKNGNLVTKSVARRERMGHITLAAPVAHIWFMRGVPSTIGLLLDMTIKNIEQVVYFASYIVLSVEGEERDRMLAQLESETTAAKEAIRLRYEAASKEAAKSETVNLKALEDEHKKELEQLEEDYIEKKTQLESLVKGALMTEQKYAVLPEEMDDIITVDMGARAIRQLLEEIDLTKMSEELREEAETATAARAKKAMKRLKVVEGLLKAGAQPTDLVLTVLPVIPPDLRPIVSLAGGRFATSDLNDLYRRVINRNNRLKKMLELNAPEVICRNEKRMLQEAVDALVDGSNARTQKAAATAGSRHRLKSIADMLKGKQGRFRQNLLGKRVDYSGRSVIVVGPELSIDQCGLPKQMAMELFKPFVVSWLIRNEHAASIRHANQMIETNEAIAWDALDDVIKGRYVLLNRAPTLHRLGIQAFQPKLVDGQAIQLQPLVAKGFNADYDGDQMAVHLPISNEAQEEAKELVAATRNLLKPADGSPVLAVYQDIVLGSYYMTYDKERAQMDHVPVYSSVAEAEMAYDKGRIQLQTPIKLPVKGEVRETTFGRVLFNEALPEEYPYDNNVQTVKQIKKVLDNVFNTYGRAETVETADRIKALSFQYETVSGTSTSKDDYISFPEIDDFTAEGDAKEALIADQYDNGLIDNDERYRLVVASWREVDNKIKSFVTDKLKDMDTNIGVMVNSGARGSASNIKLASAMIGLMVDVNNHEIELPVKSNFKDGLSSLEAFVAARGARQGLVSTALKTADSGYLTRRLVDVAQDVFTSEVDNSDDPGFAVLRSETEETMVDFKMRIGGRYAAEDVAGYLQKGELITEQIAAAIEADEKIESVKIQSVLTTPSLARVPRTSYGLDLATKDVVESDQPVGVIAAQSVGEPGTQLTLDTFHSSGVAGGNTVAQGLPRVEELLEARAPKGQAITAPVAGIVDVERDGKKMIVTITPQAGKTVEFAFDGKKPLTKDGKKVKVGEALLEGVNAPFVGVVQLLDDKMTLTALPDSLEKINVPDSLAVMVTSGQEVVVGDRLTSGSLNLHNLMQDKGIEAAERYILNEILKIYAAQGQDVNAKHLEVIIRQMFSRVMIDNPGDTGFTTGEMRSKASVVELNEQLTAEGKEPCSYTQLLLGIAKVAVNSDSFLSAASFQDTNRVLIRAAISGQVDHLRGLKENVIIGRKIPVGTGVRKPKIVMEFSDELSGSEEQEMATDLGLDAEVAEAMTEATEAADEDAKAVDGLDEGGEDGDLSVS
ncbi:DNA-directed RNA polymerase subunit beta' [Candidatus Saccharibacteria bacterium]|nr:DNA-directed RNA polymerase subunit beta' [Candidatus Saccharibacteria bacterium]